MMKQFLLCCLGASALFGQISLTTPGSPYTQDFNSLANSGTTASDLPAGWVFLETGTNANTTYGIGTGSSNAGNTYSFGPASNVDRALGGLLSGSLTPTLGASFTNNTGATITSLTISYTGEQWRLGALSRTDRLDFQYSTNATSLNSGAWTDVDMLDFVAPVQGPTVGSLDGNAVANRTAVSHTITGLTIPAGATFWIRWNDFNATGADDGLAVDDFSLTPETGSAPTISLSPTTLPALVVGSFVNVPITVNNSSGCTLGIFAGSLPAGLTLSASSISGTPNNASGYDFTLSATGCTGGGSAQQQYTGTVAPAPVLSCGGPKTFIGAVQGTGLTSPLVGSTVTVEGIVNGSFLGTTGLSGFYMQDPADSNDGNSATSDGLFVFYSNPVVFVNTGDRVRVRGTVAEFASGTSSLTQLTSIASVEVCTTGNTVTPIDLNLPVSNLSDLEPYEGMLVRFPQSLTVTDNFTHGRFGELVLATSRQVQYTQANLPGIAGNSAHQETIANSRIMLDDSNGQQNRDPIYHPASGFSAGNTVRGGSTVAGLTGVLDQRFSFYRIQPLVPVDFTAAPRSAVAPAPGGRFKIGFLNVLNFFNGDGIGGGFPTSRGADTPAELERQAAKLVAALNKLDAAVVGLSELENDPDGPGSAVEELVSRANNAAGFAKWAPIFTGVMGGDEIRNGIIYQPALVSPVGNFKYLDSTIDPDFFISNRPALAQQFQPAGTPTKPELQRFFVVVNHLKSKGTSSGQAGDADSGDGQGLSNGTRTRAAQALGNWLKSTGFDATPAADRKIIIIGDLNAYLREDPITSLVTAGFPNLIDAIGAGPAEYSFSFRGQWGNLDHALVSQNLLRLVSGFADWHINADEPGVIDYNVEFKSAWQVTLFYAPDEFRSSDHDPLVLGMNPLCGDLDDDGDVDAVDQALMRSAIGKPGNLFNRRYDFDGSGGKDRTGTISLNDWRQWSVCAAAYQR